MFEETFKILFYPLTVLSCFGIVFAVRKHLRIFLVLFFIVALCMLWRNYSFYNTSRYYSILIFIATFFSAYAISILSRVLKPLGFQSALFALLILVLGLFHTIKCFLGSKNSYISDLSETIQNISANGSDDDTYIYDREFMRLKNLSDPYNEHTKIFFANQFSGLTDLYCENGSFHNNLYLIVSCDYPISIEQGTKRYPNNDDIKYYKVQHHFSNSRHTKYISVYKHEPFLPYPDIDLSSIPVHAVLKAYIPEYDAFIFYSEDKLIWLIGSEITKKTEIVYHIYTDEADLLPKSRIQYGFENWGFFAGDQSKRKQIGHYSYYEKPIPTKYPISYIKVGFNSSGSVVFRTFSLQ